MGELSLKSYVAKCVLGGEILYVLCLAGGYLPWRSQAATDLHHNLFETLPGFIWGSFGSVVLGGLYALAFSVAFGAYMVWMHNSSLTSRA
ncbi:MAG: hypothetical protein HYV68_01550 [Candidatus Taylorbacteria bacterium]|nr:hypothetical protein [Candidatus Taylorbacteria bacterium]